MKADDATPIDATNVIATALMAYGLGLDAFSIWTPDGWKPQQGFPRRELLCKPSSGGSTWSVKTKRFLQFCGLKLA